MENVLPAFEIQGFDYEELNQNKLRSSPKKTLKVKTLLSKGGQTIFINKDMKLVLKK